MIIHTLDGAIELALDAVEASGMIIEAANDLPKALPHLFLKGLKAAGYHRGELVNSHPLARHRSIYSISVLRRVNASVTSVASM